MRPESQIKLPGRAAGFLTGAAATPTARSMEYTMCRPWAGAEGEEEEVEGEEGKDRSAQHKKCWGNQEGRWEENRRWGKRT